jgi:type I restriction enzyme M protein
MNQQSLSSFIWSVADLLCGDYRQSEYGKVIFECTEKTEVAIATA